MDNISFRRLKTVIKAKGLTLLEVAERCGMKATALSRICTDRAHPKTDTLARMCSALKVYPSEIVSFGGIEVKEQYFTNDRREPLPEKDGGLVTYKPLWFFLADYLAEYNSSHDDKKKENDLFDQIDPPRRLKGYTGWNLNIANEGKKFVTAKYGEEYKSKRPRPYERTKGLPLVTRVKLRNDRPLNLSVIYEICKKLGCTIDFVMSYK